MQEKEFERLVRERENQDLDFKAELPESKKLAQLVTALYNSRGGKIVLGAGDKTRELVGVKEPQKAEHRFVQVIRHWCKLDEEPRIEFVKHKNKDFIVFHCPKGRDTPYFVRGEHTPRVRIGSSNMPANKEEIARLYREGSSKSQDIYPVESASLADLNLEKVKTYLKKSKLTEQLDKDYLIELMLKEHFIVKESEEFIPTIAGILLFGKNPYLNLHHSEVKADRYVGDTRVEWLDREDLRGTLFEILEQTKRFFLKNMRTPAKVVGFKTVVRTEYPIEALREAIINALAHRDWHKQETIMIRMYNSFIEIVSPGELLRPLALEDIKKDEYVPETRNKVIAGVFNNLGIMDKRGTGFLRIRESLDKWNLPHPEFEERQGWFVIRFTNPNVEKIPKIDETGLNERQKKALEYLKTRGKITTKEYVALAKTTIITAKRDLLDLKKKKIVRFAGSPKTGYYCFFDDAVNDTVNDAVKKAGDRLAQETSQKGDENV